MWFSWPFPCGCTKAAVASASQLHSTQELEDMEKGKETSKKLHQQLPSFPWILQSDGVSYLYIVLVGIMPTYCSHCRDNKKQEETSPWLNQASPYNSQPVSAFFSVPLMKDRDPIFIRPQLMKDGGLIHNQNDLTNMILWLNHPPQHLHPGSAPPWMPLGQTPWPVG